MIWDRPFGTYRRGRRHRSTGSHDLLRRALGIVASGYPQLARDLRAVPRAGTVAAVAGRPA
jgi:hypothetical protein